MNDYDPNKNNMSRSSRSKKQKIEPKFARKSKENTTGHKGLRTFLSVIALVILSSVPVYGFWANQKYPEKRIIKTASDKKSSTSDQKSSSEKVDTSSDDASTSSEVESESQSSEEVSSAISSSSSNVSSSEAMSSQVSASSATKTAVLGASQTLYNFATTHGMTTAQVVALNPGLTVDNYTQYAGRDLNTQ